MVVVVGKLRAFKGKEKQVEQLLRDVASKVRQNERDTVMYQPHRKIGDPCDFFVYEQYKDNEAREIHRSAEYTKEIKAALPDLLEGGLEVSEYEIL